MTRHRLGIGFALALWFGAVAPALAAPPSTIPDIHRASNGVSFVEHQLIIQLPIAPEWGTDHDLKVRYSLEKRLKRRLGKLGVVDGGDIGSGNMNIFIFKITDVDSALLKVKSVLQRRLDRRWPIDFAVIELTSYRRPDDEDPVSSVVWPIGYQGKFSIF